MYKCKYLNFVFSEYLSKLRLLKMSIVCPDCPSGARPIEGCELIETQNRMHMFACKTCGDGYNKDDRMGDACNDYKIIGEYLVCRHYRCMLCPDCTAMEYIPGDCYMVQKTNMYWGVKLIVHRFSHDCVVESDEPCPKYGVVQQKCYRNCGNSCKYTRTMLDGAACSKCADTSMCRDRTCRERIENSSIGRISERCTEHISAIECIECKGVFRGHNMLRCAKCIPIDSAECRKCNKVLKYGTLLLPLRDMTMCLRCDDWRGGYKYKGTLHELFISTNFRLFESRVKLVCATIPCNIKRALCICAATLQTCNGAKPGYLRKLMLRNVQDDESPMDDSGYACLVLMQHYRIPNDIRLMIIHMYEQGGSVERMLRRKHEGM